MKVRPLHLGILGLGNQGELHLGKCLPCGKLNVTAISDKLNQGARQ